MRSREAVGQGGLEPGAGGQAADPRGPQVRELLQGDLLRQRHQGGADLGLGLRGAARLVPHQRDEGRGARQGQQAHRLEADDVARDLHAGHAGLAGRRSTGPSRSSSPTRSRATPSATTPTSSCRKHPWRMDDEKLAVPVLREARRRPASSTCACTRDSSRRRRRKQFPNLLAVRRRARRRQGGEGLAAAQLHHLPLGVPLHRRRAGRRLGAVRADGPRRLGHRSRRDSRRSTASRTSTATSARSSRRARSPSRACARR